MCKAQSTPPSLAGLGFASCTGAGWRELGLSLSLVLAAVHGPASVGRRGSVGGPLRIFQCIDLAV